MKLFGVSPFAIRYPGVLMGSIGVLMVYRISLLMTANRHLSFLAALLTCFSYYPLELLSGQFGMDQNDTAFSFYVLASLWAYAEYTDKKTLKYAMLIGVFAGCAILVKWLTGLLVFSGWGLVILSSLRKENFRIEVAHYVIALLACTVVFLPWQLYIMHTFPVEAHYEYAYNLKHVYESVEGRAGDWLFYINHFNLYYGAILCWVLPIGLLLLIVTKEYRTKLSFAVLFYFVTTLFFFSIVSKTMLQGYLAPMIPIGNIFIAIAVFKIIVYPRILKFAYIPTAIICALLILNLPEITHKHDPENVGTDNGKYWTAKRYNELVYRDLRKYLPADIKIVLNANDYEDVMFYNNDIDAYFQYISPEDFNKIKQQHLRVGIFNAHNDPLPDYVWSYDSVFLIRQEIK